MTRRRPTARRAPARGGQQGYEPPVTRMRRDERLLELALERWSQRQIAADVGLTQGGVSKALRRIFTRQLTTLTEEGEAYRLKLVLLAERRARAAREGHARSQADVTTPPAAQGGGGWRGGGHDGRRARNAVRRGQSDLLGGGTAVRRVRREAARLGRAPRSLSGRGATGPRSGRRQRPPHRPPLVRHAGACSCRTHPPS